jgi:RimJ/RimL family protein N-acetyltransferase
MIVLETSRLLLRQFHSADLNDLTAILSDPDIMKFSATGVMTTAQIQDWLDRALLAYQTRSFGIYAAIDQTTQRFIGFCGFIPETIDQQPEVMMSYRFGRDYWGKGLATEAAQAVRDYGFAQLELTRFVCIIEAANARSIRVAEKIGMHHEKDVLFLGNPVQIYAIER